MSAWPDPAPLPVPDIPADADVYAVAPPSDDEMAADRERIERASMGRMERAEGPGELRPTPHFNGHERVEPVWSPAEDGGEVTTQGIQRRALADCVSTFREWLHMPDTGGLYVTLAAVAANRAPGDPVWLLLISPPGGGKTETLMPLARLPDVHLAATLTEAALLSGTPKKEAKDAKGGLLREIGDFGIVVAKDFGSVLSMHRDARAAVLAALREVYDGSWTRHVGTDGGRTLAWSGKVGLIAGCTPSIDSHHAVIGSMGERFVFYRLARTDADAQARRSLAHVGHEAAMRAALGGAVERALSAVDADMLVAPADAPTTDRIVAVSTLAVRCRSAVERDGRTREVDLVPEPEAPARLALVLLRLWNALRAIGVDEAEAWRLVTKCALDSMPALRRRVLAYLLSRDVPASTTEVAERVDHPTVTTRRALEDLTAHGILTRHRPGERRADLWQPTDWTRGRWATVSEMSGDPRSAPATASEMSGDMRAEHENGASERPLNLPLRIGGDFSDTDAPPVEDDYPPGAWAVDDEARA